jgi:hypothetical protein
MRCDRSAVTSGTTGAGGVTTRGALGCADETGGAGLSEA